MSGMVLARAWRRRLYGGVLTAALVPAALLAALATLAVSGGFGQLGALAQALSGPPTPRLAPAASSRPPSARLLATVSAAAPAAAAAPTTSRVPIALLRTTHPAPLSSRPRPVGPPGSRPSRPSSPPQPVHHQPPPGPAPHPTLIDGIVSAGTSVTSQLPAPAGPVATKTLQTVGSTVDKVIPPLPLSHH